jgi:hypothetical protein
MARWFECYAKPWHYLIDLLPVFLAQGVVAGVVLLVLRWIF